MKSLKNLQKIHEWIQCEYVKFPHVDQSGNDLLVFGANQLQYSPKQDHLMHWKIEHHMWIGQIYHLLCIDNKYIPTFDQHLCQSPENFHFHLQSEIEHKFDYIFWYVLELH